MQNKFFYIFLFMVITSQAFSQFQGGTQILNSHTEAAFFGWAVADLEDINADSIKDYIIGDITSNRAVVYSGADGQVIHTFLHPNSFFGYAVADAGDVDGDAVNDIIVGGPANVSSTGISIVYSGATGNIIWSFTGENSGDALGSSVSSAGDVNSDGRADLIIGAPNNTNQGAGSGRVYIYSGMDGLLIRNLEAEAPGDGFGGGVALLGDLNNDGIKDHIVGAHTAGGTGKAFVFSGADGDDLFDLHPTIGGSVFGQFFAANSGDVNNDGIDDIYVGDYNHNNGDGKAYVFSGSDQQLLHSFNGATGEGAGPGRSAGDVNSDGYADIIVGFYTAETAQAGRATVFSGKDGTILQSFIHTIANSQLGFDAVGLGDVDGDGKFDYLLSAANAGIVYVVAGEVTDVIFMDDFE